MKVVQISAEPRTELGKKANKAARKNGSIPAVIYSVNGVEHFSTTASAVKGIVYTPELKIAEIELGGKKKKALLKDIDFHPVTDEIVHIDFLELVDGHPVNANVPIKFKGVSPGVKAGGKLMASLRNVKIKTTPDKLVDELFVDISSLELAQSVRVKDLELPEGVEVKADGNTPIAIIEVPRALKSAATAAKKEDTKKK